MGRPRSVEVEPGLHLEHVVTRKLLRLVGWRSVPVEIPVQALVELGVSTGSECQFLVFGGSKTRGGSRDLLGVFRSEEMALAAFHDLRTKANTGTWGEVVRLDSNGRHSQRCWFDDAIGPGRAGEDAPAGRRWWRR